MGNAKISITAEFISLIRSKDDPKNLYFVSPKTQRIYNFVKKLVSEKKLKEIFDWRLRLSEIINDKITDYNPEQILEFGCGYSLRGFNLCLKNKDLVYIDSDLDSLVSKKSEIIEKICQKENISRPQNYHLINIDALNDNFLIKIKDFVSKDKKTLILAEGLTTYFTDGEFGRFLKNTKSFQKNFINSEFFSNENFSYPRGTIYKLLRRFISFITRTKMPRQFKSAEEFNEYLNKQGIANAKIEAHDPGFLFYSLN